MVNVGEAIGAALDDLRHVVAITRSAYVSKVDLTGLKGGRQYLTADTHPKLQDAYTGAIDRGLARLPGLKAQGNTITTQGA